MFRMSKYSGNKRLAKIVETAEEFFGQPVVSVAAPGGTGRSSYRLTLPDRSVIGTLRPNFRRTHLEALVLQNLSRHCEDVPECLGVVDKVMFQSNVGDRRLNMEISLRNKRDQVALADQAVAAIYRFQSAARQTLLHESLPHLGANTGWVEQFVNAADALARYMGEEAVTFDRTAAFDEISHSGVQFVKWDCRSGNAAIGDDERLRWFDFEYSGLRHGAEDFAWLIGDEAWPIAPETMLDITRDNFDPNCGHDRESYLNYLSVYLTFHCVQRLKLIVKEAKKRGWLSKHKVRKYDDAGVHPEFAAHICSVGEYFAARSTTTAPLARYFESARKIFLDILTANTP